MRDVRWPPLVCPIDESAFESSPDGLRCPSCDLEPTADAFGIVRFGPGLQSQALSSSLRTALQSEVTLSALASNAGADSGLESLIDPHSSAIASVVGLYGGELVLCICGRWQALPTALSYLGARVVLADIDYDLARLSQVAYPALDAPMHVDAGIGLPWSRDCFDTAFVDLLDVDRSTARALLNELTRVLKPGASLVIGVENGLLSAALRIRDRKRGRAVRNADRRRSRSLGRLWAPWADLLNGTAWRAERVLIAHPAADHLRQLLPNSQLGLRRSGLRGLAGRLGIGSWMARDYLVIARQDDSPSALGIGMELLGESAVTIACSDVRVAIDSSTGFIKVPLAKDQEYEVADEVRRTQRAALTRFAPHVLSGVRLDTWRGRPIARYPHLEQLPRRPDDLPERVARALSDLSIGQFAQLRDTDLFARIEKPDFPENVRLGEFAALTQVVLCHASHRVPVGPSHGDLHSDNILVSSSGELIFVDWQRAEESNPLFVDLVSITLDFCNTTPGRPLPELYRELLEDHASGPVVDAMKGSLGEVPLTVALMASVLNTVSALRYSLCAFPPDQALVAGASYLARMWNSGRGSQHGPTVGSSGGV